MTYEQEILKLKCETFAKQEEVNNVKQSLNNYTPKHITDSLANELKDAVTREDFHRIEIEIEHFEK
jgi:hypothetical protein